MPIIESDIVNRLSEKSLPSADDYINLAGELADDGNYELSARVIFAARYLFRHTSAFNQRITKLRNDFPGLGDFLRYDDSELLGIDRKKVFGIGLSRTATNSLSEALKIYGYKTAHWLNDDKEIIGWGDFLEYDALCDTSVSFIFETIYFAYPDAKFIYTVRNEKDWLDSIVKHFHWVGGFDKLLPRCEENKRKSGRVGTPLWKIIHRSLYANNKNWLDAYKAYDKRVTEFFDDKKDVSFLKIDLTDKSYTSLDKWRMLGKFVGAKHIPLLPFPHKNKKS